LITIKSIIGNHFSKDKLLNYIQLREVSKSAQNSDYYCSIDQRAADLKPIVFTNAIDFTVKSIYQWLVPVILILLIYITGHNQLISQSLNRVVHFKTEFLPPAPSFVLLNSKLEVEANSDYVRMQTIGDVVPENAVILLMEKVIIWRGRSFNHRVKPINNLVFHVEANGVSSQEFILKGSMYLLLQILCAVRLPALYQKKIDH
jgi:hypothetical protein